jgi:hypothetical protein
MKKFRVCVTKTEYYYTTVMAESCGEAEDNVIDGGLDIEGPDFTYDDWQVEVFSVWEIKQ